MVHPGQFPTPSKNIQHFVKVKCSGPRGSLTLTEIQHVFGRCWIMLDGARGSLTFQKFQHFCQSQMLDGPRGSLTLTEILDVFGKLDNAWSRPVCL